MATGRSPGVVTPDCDQPISFVNEATDQPVRSN
ncbi:hypothetical protein RLEG12_04490 (plasmid) [Rhizobium leguminosarum bv. trifolii CB782]|nr:hypothetical protein RLEG12_04490 [Rhizobium leguminosarum bv. trifolii CB782]